MLAVIAAWLLIAWAGDRWWFATVIMFGPRWGWFLPVLLLVPLALTTHIRRYALVPLMLGCAIVAWGPMGFCVPWRAWSVGDGPGVRVLTCNVEGRAGGPAAFRDLVIRLEPDAVALQEVDWDDQAFASAFPEDWAVERAGKLLVATPHEILDTQTHLRTNPPSRWPPINGLFCEIETPQGRIGFCSVHLRTPRVGLYTVVDRQTGLDPRRSAALTEETEQRRIEAEEITEWLQRHDVPLIVAGDLNTPVESAIYEQSWSGFGNAYSQAGWAYGTTKVSKVKGVQFGSRIDHVLFDRDHWQARKSQVMYSIGSDHLPLYAELGAKSGEQGAGSREQGVGARR